MIKLINDISLKLYKLNSDEVGDVFQVFMDLRDKADYLHQRDKKFLSHPSEDLTHCAQLLYKIGQILTLIFD